MFGTCSCISLTHKAALRGPSRAGCNSVYKWMIIIHLFYARVIGQTAWLNIRVKFPNFQNRIDLHNRGECGREKTSKGESCINAWHLRTGILFKILSSPMAQKVTKVMISSLLTSGFDEDLMLAITVHLPCLHIITKQCEFPLRSGTARGVQPWPNDLESGRKLNLRGDLCSVAKRTRKVSSQIYVSHKTCFKATGCTTVT